MLAALVLASCAHRRDLIPTEHDLAIYIRKGEVRLRACEGDVLGPFDGWPSPMRARPLAPLLVLGLRDQGKPVVLWGCNLYRHEELVELHGFLSGLPLYVARDADGWKIRFGDASYGPFDAAQVNLPMSEYFGEPVYIASKEGKVFIGFGSVQNGPFDEIVDVLTVGEDRMILRVRIGRSLMDIAVHISENRSRPGFMIPSDMLPSDP